MELFKSFIKITPETIVFVDNLVTLMNVLCLLE